MPEQPRNARGEWGTYENSDAKVTLTADGANINITRGHLARHTPSGTAGGSEAAIIDVGQDLLLGRLAERGLLDLVAFKGGTALRKLYAGASGRFSTDLDFSVANLGDDRDSVIALLESPREG